MPSPPLPHDGGSALSGSIAFIPELDGLRAVAVFMVVVAHWTETRLYPFGIQGVSIFFVISGYLITTILLGYRDSFRSPLSCWPHLKLFYYRRFLRIFPIYYLFLFCAYLITTEPQRPEYTWFVAYMSNVHFALDGWSAMTATSGLIIDLTHTWSLAVEEQFYLCWPAVVFLLGRRSLMLACVACVLGAPVFRFALIEGAVDPLANSLASGVLAPARMDALALGGFLALAARRPEELRRLLRWARPVAWASAFVLLGLFFWRGRLSFFDDWVQTVGYTANAFLFGAILTLAVTAAPNTAVHSVCTHRFLTFFGRYSYALYLFHFQIAALLARRVREAGGLPTVAGLEVPARTVVALLGISSSVILAWLSWHLYEKQFFKLKVLFPYGGRPGGTSNLQRGKL